MADSDSSFIIVIGRGHSGTRILAHTLCGSEVFMGRWLNSSGDKVPGGPVYDASRIIARYVDWEGNLSWDFSRLHTMSIDAEFTKLIDEYLEDLRLEKKKHKGWKLPETTLVYPWIARLFPEARYVHIVRDPRDCLLGRHFTDDLEKFGISYPPMDDELDRRVASWKYQHEIVKATPKPRNFISVRYEDLVLDQEPTLRRLEAFLDIPLARVVVNKTRIGKWKAKREILKHMEPLASDMRECGYAYP
jgi:hypothetical protein